MDVIASPDESVDLLVLITVELIDADADCAGLDTLGVGSDKESL